jgi:hypothetical protein
MAKASEANPIDQRLTKLDVEIAEAENEVRGFRDAYERLADPQDKIGFNRSIWNAPEGYRLPFTDAGKRLGQLTAERRILRTKR